jgi:hypothetical protein
MVLESPPFTDPRDVVKGVYSSGDSWDMLLFGEARILAIWQVTVPAS